MTTTTKTHTHRAAETMERAFAGPVSTDRQNPAAHGNVTVIDACRCGAERRRNINGRHSESSGWIVAGEET